MGNENKIKEAQIRLENTKNIFLPEEIDNPEGKSSVYSLEKEYSKTKHNHQKRVILFIAVFIVGVVAGSIFLTQVIDQSYQKKEVKISEFEDINLTDLLNSAQHYETELDKTKAELKELKKERAKELSTATDKKMAQKIRQKYERKILFCQNKISELKNNISLFSKKMKKEDKEKKEILSNDVKLQELKLKEQELYYQKKMRSLTARYNPYFTDRKSNILLKGMNRQAASKLPQPLVYNPLLAKEVNFKNEDFKQLHNNINNSNYLMKKLLRIPYINSVKPALRKVNNLNNLIIDDYERLQFDLAQKMEIKNETISGYNYAFDVLLEKSPEGGLIVDPRDSNKIIIHINKHLSVNENYLGLVFRKDDQYLAKISFYKKNEIYYAKIIEIVTGAQLKPMDKILIKSKAANINLSELNKQIITEEKGTNE